jgi:prepilin-type N-terminal cleavage/methylation domain-containing protein
MPPPERRLQAEGGLGRRSGSEGGFTLIEFMIASLVMAIVLGSTVGLATQIQQAFQADMDDAAVQQEARFALEWISRELRSAASDPYNAVLPGQEIWIDPNAGADNNDSIRFQADISGATPDLPPDGIIDDPGENVTIALDAANRVITRDDANAGGGAVAMTDAIFTDLSFTPLNDAGVATANPSLVSSVRVSVTAESRGRNIRTFNTTDQDSRARPGFTRFTLTTQVRLRAKE